MPMDKLIRLINEYGHTDNCGPFETYRIEPATEWNSSYLVLSRDDNGEGDWKDWHLPILRLISKEYGFINRLVRKNKIKATDIAVKFQDEIDQFMHPYMTYDNYVNMFIMLLSIQERPIDFLISILK